MNEENKEELKLQRQRSRTLEERKSQPRESSQKMVEESDKNPTPSNGATNGSIKEANGVNLYTSQDLGKIKNEKESLLQRLQQANDDLIYVFDSFL